jgi:hypothetical protein
VSATLTPYLGIFPGAYTVTEGALEIYYHYLNTRKRKSIITIAITSKVGIHIYNGIPNTILSRSLLKFIFSTYNNKL